MTNYPIDGALAATEGAFEIDLLSFHSQTHLTRHRTKNRPIPNAYIIFTT